METDKLKKQTQVYIYTHTHTHPLGMPVHGRAIGGTDQGGARGRATETESENLKKTREAGVIHMRDMVMPQDRRAEVEPGGLRTKDACIILKLSNSWGRTSQPQCMVDVLNEREQLISPMGNNCLNLRTSWGGRKNWAVLRAGLGQKKKKFGPGILNRDRPTRYYWQSHKAFE